MKTKKNHTESEKKIAELERKISTVSKDKENYRTLFDSIIFGIQEIDTKGTIVYSNAGDHKIHGYEDGELIGKSILDFLETEAEQKELAEYLQHLVQEQPIPTPWISRDKRKDGKFIDLRIDWNYKFDQDGKVVGFISLLTDITEKMKLQKDLYESEEKYSKLFNSEIDAITIFDAETRKILDCNNAFLKLYGYTREEALQLAADDISGEPEKTAASIKDSAEKGETRVRRRLHKKKDGTQIIVDIATGPFMLQGKKVMFARLHDITKHVQDEEALHESEERFRVAFLTSPDSININKMDGTYVEINEGYTKLTGYTREDVIDISSTDINIWDDLNDRKTLMEELQKSGRVENLEAKFRMKDGSVKTGLMSASIIQLYGEPHILSIARDITNRKQAEEDKAKLEAQLRQVYKMEAIGTMAGGIAHDFNNILTIILGNADLARYVTKDNGPAKVYIDHILEASGRAKEMVRQILAFSRKAKQDLVSVKPHMVFTETLTLLRSTIPSTVEIRQNFSTECRNIKADHTQLNQILLNLSANAVYAMNEKGVLDVSLKEVKLDKGDTKYKKHLKPGPYAMLTVTDTGEGMSNEVIERIFDPFFTTKKFGEGTGMGLSVVHGIIESHDGMISVESTLGKGTTFRIYFPIINETAEQTRNTNPIHFEGNEKILFVDDEESLVAIGTEMLRLLGYGVTAKTSSLDAFETFKTNPDDFDLVITDQTMPNMSGTELAVEILKMRPDIPIILCTGYSSKISDEMAKEIGVADYFMKPFDTEQLARIIRRTLDRA